MPLLAEVEDVGYRLQRVLVGAELLAAAVLLEEASALARLNVPGIEAARAANADYAVIVTGRVAGAVARVLRNPDGKVQESIDDYAYRRADAVADGSLYLSAEDLAALRPPGSSGSASRVGSQRLLARGYGA